MTERVAVRVRVVDAVAAAAGSKAVVVGSKAVAGVLAAAELEVTGPGNEGSGSGPYVVVVVVRADSAVAVHQVAVAREKRFPVRCHLRVPFLVGTYIRSNQRRSRNDSSRV